MPLVRGTRVPAVVYRDFLWVAGRFGCHSLRATGALVDAFLKLAGVAERRFCTFYHTAAVVCSPYFPGFVEH